MLSRSAELLDANPPKAPTWRASCRCFTMDSLPRGTPDSCSGFGVCRTRRLTQETVDLYWFGPRDRVIAFTSSRRLPLRWIDCYDRVVTGGAYILSLYR
jgi:hypothetical protein